MKKLLTMIAVILALTGAIVWEEITIQNYIGEIKQKTEYIIEISTGLDNIQTDEISMCVDDLKKTWIHHEKVLSMFSNHKDIRDLCIEIQKLEANIQVNQYEDFSAGLKVISHLADDYLSLMGTTWQNIF